MNDHAPVPESPQLSETRSQQDLDVQNCAKQCMTPTLRPGERPPGLPELPKPPEQSTPVIRHPGVSARQARAIQLLLAGQTLTRVARELGVHRNTLAQWRQNVHFAMELAARQRELLESAGAQARLLAHECLSVIDARVSKARDPWVALRFLRDLGMHALAGAFDTGHFADEVIRRRRILRGQDPDARITPAERQELIDESVRESEEELEEWPGESDE
jgi:DNA-binding CsgD family transcriptional regulator